jgi:predicted CXXCH cytochrome family protein
LWDPQADLNRTFGATEPQRPRTDRGDGSPKNPPTGVWSIAGRRYDPGFATLSCLRCHDGALARDFVPSTSGPPQVNTFHPGTRAAGHGRSDHPVGVPYPAVNRGYRPMSQVLSAGAIRLPGGYVECLSCHDPHNDAGQPHMLVMNNTGSRLCLSCHRK